MGAFLGSVLSPYKSLHPSNFPIQIISEEDRTMPDSATTRSRLETFPVSATTIGRLTFQPEN